MFFLIYDKILIMITKKEFMEIIHTFSDEQLNSIFLSNVEYNKSKFYPTLHNEDNTHSISILASGYLSFLYTTRIADGITTIFRLDANDAFLGFYEISYNIDDFVDANHFVFCDELDPHLHRLFIDRERGMRVDIDNPLTYEDTKEPVEPWWDLLWKENVLHFQYGASMSIGGFPTDLYSPEKWPHVQIDNDLVPLVYLGDIWNKNDSRYTVFVGTPIISLHHPHTSSQELSRTKLTAVMVNERLPEHVILKNIDDKYSLDMLTISSEKYYTDSDLPDEPYWEHKEDLLHNEEFIAQFNSDIADSEIDFGGSIYVVKDSRTKTATIIWQHKE
jgi:hypothetical protein